MKSEDKEVADQFTVLRENTRLTGRVHEAQLLQFKYWPVLCFSDMVSSETTFEITDDNKRTVFVNLKMAGRRKPKAAEIANLEENVKWLLGEDWALVIEVKGKKIYEGPRTERAHV